jgi:hypothetical protein
VRLHKGVLTIPARDSAGEMRSLQFIGPDGDKRFLTGGEMRGCYFGIGKPNGPLCIAEGYATGASIHAATGHAVAVAFDAGNLEPAALALRAKYPGLRIVLCADDDYQTPRNRGIRKATEAALVVGGLLAVPDFGADRPDGATDFNDLAQHRGREAVERAIANAAALVIGQVPPTSENAPAGDPASQESVEPPTPEAESVDKDGGDDRPTAKALIKIAEKSCELFHDERKDGYAVISHRGIRRVVKLRGRDFRRWQPTGGFSAKGGPQPATTPRPDCLNTCPW